MFGALTLATAESGRHFTEQDLAIAEDLARRASLAIDNARLYGAEHDIAHALQQSLLPGTLTHPPGAEIAARYRPAGEGAEVGGDFYDSWQNGDIYFLAIGDVAGHGPAAAALTSLTRQIDARRQPLRAVAGAASWRSSTTRSALRASRASSARPRSPRCDRPRAAIC